MSTLRSLQAASSRVFDDVFVLGSSFDFLCTSRLRCRPPQLDLSNIQGPTLCFSQSMTVVEGHLATIRHLEAQLQDVRLRQSRPTSTAPSRTFSVPVSSGTDSPGCLATPPNGIPGDVGSPMPGETSKLLQTPEVSRRLGHIARAEGADAKFVSRLILYPFTFSYRTQRKATSAWLPILTSISKWRRFCHDKQKVAKELEVGLFFTASNSGTSWNEKYGHSYFLGFHRPLVVPPIRKLLPSGACPSLHLCPYLELRNTMLVF
jgi:hypothetical protein